MFQNNFNFRGAHLVVMVHTILFELSQISCEIYVNTFTNIYDISHKSASPHAHFCASVNEIYIGGTKFHPPALGFCKVLVI